MTSLNYVRHERSNEVNDIFSYIDCEGNKQFLTFPKSMEMTVETVNDWLSE